MHIYCLFITTVAQILDYAAIFITLWKQNVVLGIYITLAKAKKLAKK